ncbi:hypothetical protein G6F24_017029 [Rhizopus arrhizus]|nr:hypothetical protein G6F24_017029 [Rhizopus arrhizus]
MPFKVATTSSKVRPGCGGCRSVRAACLPLPATTSGRRKSSPRSSGSCGPATGDAGRGSGRLWCPARAAKPGPGGHGHKWRPHWPACRAPARPTTIRNARPIPGPRTGSGPRTPTAGCRPWER